MGRFTKNLNTQPINKVVATNTRFQLHKHMFVTAVESQIDR